jgi:hypothetical protein
MEAYLEIVKNPLEKIPYVGPHPELAFCDRPYFPRSN